jgi:endonuclease/exonuclease/phosphatase family metal-dependent hydrolase
MTGPPLEARPQTAGDRRVATPTPSALRAVWARLRHRPGRWLGGLVGLGALLALLAVELFDWAPAYLPGRTEPMRLRILSWNIGKIFFKWDSRASDQDLPAIVALLGSVDPDIVALQELRDAAQLHRLVELLGGRYVGEMPIEDRYDRHVAMLVKPRRGVEFDEVVTTSGRAALAVRIPLATTTGRVVAVHLDAFDATLRRTQAEEIIDWLNRAADGGNEREIVVVGDFNFDADFLFAQRRESTDLGIYRMLTREFVDVGQRAGGTTIVDRRLDYIFAKTSSLRPLSIRVLVGQRQRLMDHDPIVAEFEVVPHAGGGRWRSSLTPRGPRR